MKFFSKFIPIIVLPVFLASCTDSSTINSAASGASDESFTDTWTGYQQWGIANSNSLTAIKYYEAFNTSVLSHSGGGSIVAGYSYESSPLVGNNDGFIVKYDSSGTLKWEKTYGIASKVVQIYGLAEDSSKHIISVGYTSGNLNDETLQGTGSAFIMKHDTSGNLV